MACVNAFSFDWCLRQKSTANVNLFLLDGCPIPAQVFDLPRSAFLAHSALRLTCNHEGYAWLWSEQLGKLWREAKRLQCWPVLEGEAARWAVRAAIDAVVADAYGLSREEYTHLLGGFSHKSHRCGPELCIAAFDELSSLGIDAFVRKHDPYWEVPVMGCLP
jgi:hypothetical protein